MSYKVKLSDVAEIVMGQSPKGIDCNSTGNGFPLLNGPTEFTGRSPAPTQFTTAGKKFSKIGDILFCVRGSTTGRMNYADRVYAIGRGIGAIRGINGYPTPYIRAVLEYNLERLLVAATGSTFPNVGKDLLNAFEVTVCSPEEAQRANELITGIEDKRYLNTQTNQTLEAMAQAIFKSWFVDFDPVKAKMQGKQPEGMDADTAALFPDKLVESELGLIPEGWTVKPFKKVIDKYVDNRGKTPPVVEDGIPLVEVKHLPEKSAFPNLNTDKRVTEETFDTWFRVHVEPKDILISTVGTIGRTSFVKNTNFGIAQNVLGLRFGKVVEPEYMFYTVKAHRFQHDMDARLVTTVQSSIKRKDLDTIDILVPPSNVQKEFCKLVGSLLDGQYRKNAENIELASLRDALLPKLLSGELLLTNYREVANV